MKLINLFESASKNRDMIVIDVQPFYHNHHKHIVPRLIEHVNQMTGDVLWFHNGCNVGIEDTVHEQKMYLLENGMDEDRLDEITFVEKDYAFFRGWMDNGIDEDIIIAAGKYMYKNRINDSRDLEVEDFVKFLPRPERDTFTDEDELYKNEDALHWPDIDINKLKRYNNAYLVGGGRDECLEEMRLLLEMVGMKYKLLNEFIYG